MGKLLKLTTNGHQSLKPQSVYVDSLDEVDFDGIASDLMNEIYNEIFQIVRSRLVKNNIAPTQTSLVKMCESIDDLMGDMNLHEILKEVKRENKKVLIQDDYYKRQ